MGGIALADEFAQEFLLVHAVLEGLASVYEDDRNFIVELPAQFVIGIDVDFKPGESASPRKLGEALLYHFTEVTALPRVDDDTAKLWHAGLILTPKNHEFQNQLAMLAKPVRH